MESFSFLKYLRGGVVAGAQRAPAAAAATTTIAASASACEDGNDDDASFFDLEFAVPGDESAASDAEEERVEFNFAVSAAAADAAGGEGVVAPGGAAEVVDVDAPEAGTETEPEVVPAPPPAASLLRPATRFGVLLLKLRKPKAPAPAPADGAAAQAPRQQQQPPPVASRFLIKFRVDQDAPLASLFTRDNSSRTSDAGADRAATAVAAEPQQLQLQPQEAAASITAEERRFAKEVVLRYLSKIKPLYVKVSRRYGDRLRFGGAASEGEETDVEPDPSPAPSPSPSPSPSQSQAPTAAAATPAPAPQAVVVACGVRAPRASVPAGLKQVCKRLGKSRSASSAVAAAPSPGGSHATAAAGTGTGTGTGPQTQPQPQRRDDSLLQVQDGIQSAIAHCKRSFNASKGSESPLLRSMTMTTATGGEARPAGAGEGA